MPKIESAQGIDEINNLKSDQGPSDNINLPSNRKNYSGNQSEDSNVIYFNY